MDFEKLNRVIGYDKLTLEEKIRRAGGQVGDDPGMDRSHAQIAREQENTTLR